MLIAWPEVGLLGSGMTCGDRLRGEEMGSALQST